jgi:phage terminase large subunit
VNVEIELPEKAAFLLERKARYKVGHGGRAGLKSHSFAKALVVRAASEKIRILCTREIQNSISDSVMQLLKDKIEECGLSSKFSVGKSHIRCLATGSYFLFYGLKTNISKIKSLEAIDIVWIEEAAAISKNSWRTLTPTIRRDDAEIWVTFNPEHEDDPTSVMFLGPNPVPDSIVVKFGWEDADALGWFSEGMRQEKDWMYQTDPEEAIHVWGGDFKKKSNASIFGAKTLTDKDHNGNVVNTISVPAKYKVESFEVPYKIKTDPRTKKEVSRTCLWDGPYFGADFGFSNDPSTLMKLWVKPEPRA